MAVGMCEIDSRTPVCPSCGRDLLPAQQPAELAVGFLCASCNLAWVVEFAVHARRRWTCFPVTIGRIDPWMPDWRPDFDYWPGARVRDGDEEFVALRPHGPSVRPSLEADERGWTWLRLPPSWDERVAAAHPTAGPIGPRSRPSPLANSDGSDRSMYDARLKGRAC